MTHRSSQTIFLARHGETEWNVAGRSQGRLDSPLTARGIKHAEHLGEFARAQSVGQILCSPLGRARRTAEIASGVARAAVIVCDDLAEIDLGNLSGLTKRERSIHHPEAVLARARNKFGWVFPGGESYESALPRARAATSTIADSSADRVLVVSHEMIGRLLRMVLLDLSADEAMALSQPHTTVIEITGDHTVNRHVA